MKTLEEKIGYTFRDRGLLENALTHSSYANEHRPSKLVQRESGQSLSYRLIGEKGPDHDKVFAMEVLLNGQPLGTGQGRSKKEAEQAAAKAAVGKLEGKPL